MGNHRSLGEFSIDKSKKNEKEELKFSIEPGSLDSKEKKEQVVIKEKIIDNKSSIGVDPEIESNTQTSDDIYEKFLNGKSQSSTP